MTGESASSIGSDGGTDAGGASACMDLFGNQNNIWTHSVRVFERCL